MRTEKLVLSLAAICSLPFALSFSATTGALPSAKDVVDRYQQALGGRQALLRHSSSTLRGSVEVRTDSAGHTIKLAFVYFAAAPYHRLERTSPPAGAGDVLNGFDGETAWSFDPRTGSQSGAKIFSGDERESMKRDADFYYPLTELSWFKSMETVAVEDFAGRACYRLHGINNWNKKNDHFYDRETGLLAGYEFDSEQGPTHEIFADYKRIDGVLVPTKQIVKIKSKGGVWTTLETVLLIRLPSMTSTSPYSRRPRPSAT